jgi:hypothetical protein
MYAASEGRGNLGIPKAVAKEYIKETPKKALPRKVAIKRRKGNDGSY